MLNQLSERVVHRIRWGLAIAWSLLIASLFYDPISVYLTQPDALFSPFRLDLEAALDPTRCLQVQGACLPEQPYGLGARIFWAMVVPAGLLSIFVLGHEFWRRVCPLSFFSQIPRALGIQRKRKRVSSTGKTRYELVSIEQKSWLGRNFLYLQFGLLCLGLVARILLINSDRWALGSFLIGTILAAIGVGYLYSGKSWCQYFCPMAPVEMIFTGPRGLLGSKAHLDAQRGLTQSICRTVDAQTKQEKSACVGCQSPCIDIDAERSYWDRITQRDRRFVYYGYIGLVFSFYFSFLFYAGNWNYYYSGAWSHEEHILNTMWNPGFYLWGHAIPIPKLIAVPLTLALFVGLSYGLGSLTETAYRRYLQRRGQSLDPGQLTHRLFTCCTFVAWNLFWIFGSRPTINLLPAWQQQVFSAFIVLVSSIWWHRTFWRSAEQYSREGLANTLRRQLDKQGIDLAKLLNRSSAELKPDEVYVLAKVLPDVSQSQKLEVYKGVLQGAIKDGIVSSAESALLQELQTSLGISETEHYSMLANLGIEDPTLFDTMQSMSLENQFRLDSYHQGLASLLQDLVDQGTPMDAALADKRDRITALKREYRITDEEHDQILSEGFGQHRVLTQAENLLQQFQAMSVQVQVLQTQPPEPDQSVYKLLRTAIANRQIMILQRLLSMLEILKTSEDASILAQDMHTITHDLLPTVLQPSDDRDGHWQHRLAPEVFALLNQPVSQGWPPTIANSASSSLKAVLNQILQDDLEPLMRALSLYALQQVDDPLAIRAATELLRTSQPQFVQEVAQAIGQPEATLTSERPTQPLTTLAKLFCLSESPFFNQLPLTTLIDVAFSCQSRSYHLDEIICRVGDRSTEVLILFSGSAHVQIVRADQSTQIINTISVGETTGELGVLTKSPRSATVIAASEPTIVLVLEAQRLESLLQRSPALAIGLLAIISKRLQHLTKYAESTLRPDRK
ncbi:MAG TPA: cyclic nucleotide-binding domain-containing protein [Microcoleaceae cyanobacterium]|jgi:hypothetical protein